MFGHCQTFPSHVSLQMRLFENYRKRQKIIWFYKYFSKTFLMRIWGHFWWKWTFHSRFVHSNSNLSSCSRRFICVSHLATFMGPKLNVSSFPVSIGKAGTLQLDFLAFISFTLTFHSVYTATMPNETHFTNEHAKRTTNKCENVAISRYHQ